MKTIVALSVALSIASTGWCQSSWGPRPVWNRFQDLASCFNRLSTSKDEAVFVQVFTRHFVDYRILWKHSASGTAKGADLSGEQVVEIAVNGLKDKRLGVGKYRLSALDKEPIWVWVAEFEIGNNDSQGNAFNNVLFVPVSVDGELLCQVEASPQH